MKHKEYYPTLAGVFIVSSAMIIFEVLLTRLYSAVMWYHFVFLAVSMAMFALALGGIWVYRLSTKKGKEYIRQHSDQLERKSLAGMSFSMLIMTVLFYLLPYYDFMFVFYILAGGVPFIFAGTYLSLAFSRFADKSSYIYFVDLVGAAAGSGLVILLLDNFSILRTVVVIFLVLISTLMLKTYSGRARTAGSAVLLTLLVFTLLSGNVIDNIANNFGAYQGSPKLLGKLPSDAKRVFTSWDSIARTDVIETNKDENKIVLVDGASISYMIPFGDDTGKLEKLKKEPEYFPFALGNRKNALLIGPGGGRDMVLAHLAGIHDLTAVEINPGTVKAARQLKDFNGNIYDRPGTKTYVMDGRSFISRDKNSYDIIYLARVMTQNAEVQGYALSENYIYTAEALNEYYDRLTDNGILAFGLHGNLDLVKALATALDVLEKKGISQEAALKQIAIVNTKMEGMQGHAQLHYPLLIIKKTPFSNEETAKLMELTKGSQGEPVHVPGVYEKMMFPAKEELKKWVVYDNSPFFYNVSTGVPGYIWLILVAVVLFGMVFFPWAILKGPKEIKHFSIYFSLLGIGFMLVEIPLLQKFILFFGHPTLTFAVVIASILLAGGLGSFTASYIGKRVTPTVIGFAVAALVIVFNLTLGNLLETYQGLPLVQKVGLVFAVLLPVGFMLGMPFPMGIRKLSDKYGSYVPVMWGINGWMSVIGSVLALVLAISFGFTQTLYIGALCYVLLALVTYNGSY